MRRFHLMTVGGLSLLVAGCENVVSSLVKRSVQARRIAAQITLLSDELARLEAGEVMREAA